MCPWLGPHVPSFGRQLWEAAQPCGVSLSTGVLLPRIYGMTASLLWLELRGFAAWQAMPSCTLCRLACHPVFPRLRVMFAVAPMQPGRARTSGLGVPLLLLAQLVGWVASMRPTLGLWLGVPCPSAALGVLACAVSLALWRLFTGVCVLCLLCAVSVATWRLFTSVPADCGTCLVLVASLRSPANFSFVVVYLLVPCLFFSKVRKKGRGGGTTTGTGMGS